MTLEPNLHLPTVAVHGGDKPGQWIVGGVSMRAV
jgi:hypothetical protein